jgi:predicted glutamine amidotransferase
MIEMCRWLAYSGELMSPATVILDTPHSLVEQSLHSPLGKETVNGDGFGLGWYPADGNGGKPWLYRSIEPAWYNENLRDIAGAVQSSVFFAHVRAASGPPIQQTNCHPFRYGNWMFMHNGGLRDWWRVRHEVMMLIDPELYPLVRGTTDSEAIFHVALTMGLAEDPIAGMGGAIRKIEEVGRRLGVEHPVQGSFAVSNGVTIWAFRYSTEHRSRTLFHSEDMGTLQEAYPDVERLKAHGERSRVIVSEPLSGLPGAFIEVPESTAAILDADGYREQAFLR